jgi:oligopeptide transport system substrate-binding protein
MDMRQVEWKVLLSSYSNLGYETARSSWVGDYDDANTFLDCFLGNNGNNRTGWKNARYDALIHEANEQTDLQKRARLLEQAESLLVHDELPIIPIYYYVGLDYFDTNKIEGFYQNILDDHPLEYIGKVKSVK